MTTKGRPGGGGAGPAEARAGKGGADREGLRHSRTVGVGARQSGRLSVALTRGGTERRSPGAFGVCTTAAVVIAVQGSRGPLAV